MKVLNCLCCFVCALLYHNAAQAYFSPSHMDTSLIEKIKTEPNTEPKLSSGISLNVASSVQTDAVKYASVSFISRRSNIKMNDVSEGDDLDEKPINKVECPSGQENVDGVCVNVTACKKEFPLSSASKGVGSYVTKNCGSKGIGYCYTSCQTGWTHSGCNCNAVDCTGYPLEKTAGKNCDGIAHCKSGDTYVYKCTSCPMGYKLSNNKCIDKVCGDLGATYSTKVADHCTSVSVGKIGETYCYSCNTCEDGYTLANGSCGPNSCSYSKNASIANCIKHSITRTGTDLCYECTECENGYTRNGAHTACTANTCPSGSSTSLSSSFKCNSVSVTRTGTSFCYKCQ